MDIDESLSSVMFRTSASIESLAHLRSGLLNAELVQRIEENCTERNSIPYFIHKALVINSVISSACALEAYINEWFSAFDEIVDEAPNEAKAINRLWSLGIPRTAKFSILEKYQVALTLMGIEQFEEGREPYQSVKKIIKLRNALVHYEPTFEPDTGTSPSAEYKANNLGKELSKKFKLNPLCAETAPIWPYKLLGSGCAKWCSNLVLGFMEEFHNRDIMGMSVEVDRNWLIKDTQHLGDTDWQFIFSNKSKHSGSENAAGI